MNSLPLYLSQEQNCSYLPARNERLLFVDPDTQITMDTYSELAQQGFRRSGNLVYRPQCSHCSACLPLRVPVSHFQPSRIQRRLQQKNSDLVVTPKPAGFNADHYLLYKRYLQSRHPNGTMIKGNSDDYLRFLISQWCRTEFIEFELSGTLVAVAITDLLPTGLSAVYTFFEPNLSERSLGTFAVLWEIEYARKKGLAWLYLGYWIRECQKMSYKEKFRPAEVFREGQWVTFKKGEKLPY